MYKRQEFIRRINGLDSIEDVKKIVFDADYLVLGLGDVYPVSYTHLDVYKRQEVTVRSPKITFEQTTITLHPGERARVNATVSSGNQPAYSCSNSNVVSVDANGVITAKAAGRSYVYASEDGTKERMTVYVKEKE